MTKTHNGVFILPKKSTEGTASYSVPAMPYKNDVKLQDCQNNSEIDEDEVTHNVFFGENIKRVIKTLFK